MAAQTPWQRRNAAAQARGYRNYYDYRVHRFGKIPPGQPPVAGEEKQRLRGHRSRADLVRTLGPGDLISVAGGARDPDTGRYDWVEILVIDADGREQMYRLRREHLIGEQLESLVTDLEGKGAVFSPSPSLDLRRYLPGDHDEEEEAA